jgi:hypothetical protein
MAKRTRKQRTRRDAPGASALAGIGHNKGPVERTADEVKEQFLKHLSAWQAGQTLLAEAKAEIAKVKAAAKNDDFKVKQFVIACDLDTVSGESKRTSEVDAILEVARWVNHPLGAQLDMFRSSEGTTLLSRAEQAYEEGKTASMQDRPRKPPKGYGPQTEAYDGWMEGYDRHQRELAGGFKAPKAAKKTAAKKTATKRGRKRAQPSEDGGAEAQPEA